MGLVAHHLYKQNVGVSRVRKLETSLETLKLIACIFQVVVSIDILYTLDSASNYSEMQISSDMAKISLSFESHGIGCTSPIQAERRRFES